MVGASIFRIRRIVQQNQEIRAFDPRHRAEIMHGLARLARFGTFLSDRDFTAEGKECVR